MAFYIEDKSKTGRLIWKRLKDMNMTQKKLAKEINVSELTLMSLCDGKTNDPSVRMLMGISKVLDIPISTLIDSLDEEM